MNKIICVCCKLEKDNEEIFLQNDNVFFVKNYEITYDNKIFFNKALCRDCNDKYDFFCYFQGSITKNLYFADIRKLNEIKMFINQ